MSVFFKVCVPRSGKGEGYEMANGCGCLLAKQNSSVLSHTHTRSLIYSICVLIISCKLNHRGPNLHDAFLEKLICYLIYIFQLQAHVYLLLNWFYHWASAIARQSVNKYIFMKKSLHLWNPVFIFEVYMLSKLKILFTL